MDAAWIGVVGAAVGALAAYPVQVSLARRADAAALAQALRAERTSAYSSFAEQVMDWRRSQVIRAMLTINPETRDGNDELVRDENRRVRASAWTAYYRVKLLCDDPDIEASALDVIATTRSMKRANSRNELNAIGDDVRERLARFLEVAAKQTAGSGHDRRRPS